jgi:hypothetical protein
MNNFYSVYKVNQAYKARVLHLVEDLSFERFDPIGDRPLYDFEDKTIELHCRNIYYKIGGIPDDMFDRVEKYYRSGEYASSHPDQMQMLRHSFKVLMREGAMVTYAKLIADGALIRSIKPQPLISILKQKVESSYIIVTSSQTVDDMAVAESIAMYDGSAEIFTACRVSIFSALDKISGENIELVSTSQPVSSLVVGMAVTDVVSLCQVDIVDNMAFIQSGFRKWIYEAPSIPAMSVGCAVTVHGFLQIQYVHSFAGCVVDPLSRENIQVHKDYRHLVSLYFLQIFDFKVSVLNIDYIPSRILISSYLEGCQLTVFFQGQNNSIRIDKFSCYPQMVKFKRIEANECCFVSIYGDFFVSKEAICNKQDQFMEGSSYFMHYDCTVSDSSPNRFRCGCTVRCLKFQFMGQMNNYFLGDNSLLPKIVLRNKELFYSYLTSLNKTNRDYYGLDSNGTVVGKCAVHPCYNFSLIKSNLNLMMRNAKVKLKDK